MDELLQIAFWDLGCVKGVNNVTEWVKLQISVKTVGLSVRIKCSLISWCLFHLCQQTLFLVVCSGSMEPAFHRGDLLFLTNFHDDPIRAGEIVVFKVESRDIPIVHRVIKVHEK